MSNSAHLLLVAPSAPPKNSAEALQVGRFLAELDPSIRVTLVTTPVVAGWVSADESLTLKRSGMKVIALSLPFHQISNRILANRRLSSLHIPDPDFWLTWLAGAVMSRIDGVPDIIYSRSAPFSAALLALSLKRKLQVPWLMHLSDPWAGSPYRSYGMRAASRDLVLEAQCFAAADGIRLTTEGQAEYYRKRYPAQANVIRVTPNMMPVSGSHAGGTVRGAQLRIVYTGALYWPREPSTLLAALRMLREKVPHIGNKIKVDFYGNTPPEIGAMIDAEPICTRFGPVPFSEAASAQASADVLLTIEPAGHDPLLLHFMPSKNLDYIANGKPLLAISPAGSETARCCAMGFGWSVAPGEVERLAELLQQMVIDHAEGNLQSQIPDLSASPYRARKVTNDIWDALAHLISGKDTKDLPH